MKVLVVSVVPGGDPWPRVERVVTNEELAVRVVNYYRKRTDYAGAWITTHFIDTLPEPQG